MKALVISSIITVETKNGVRNMISFHNSETIADGSKFDGKKAKLFVTPKQLSLIAETAGIDRGSKATRSLLKGAILVGAEWHSKGDEYVNQDGEKQTYEQDGYRLNIETLDVTCGKVNALGQAFINGTMYAEIMAGVNAVMDELPTVAIESEVEETEDEDEDTPVETKTKTRKS